MSLRRPLLLSSALALALAAPWAQAAKDDRTKPLNLVFDREGAIDKVRQRSEFNGNVIMTKGSMELRAERMDVVGRVGRAPEEDLPLREAQDQNGRLARDPRRLAEEVLVEDQIADDDDAPSGEAVDRLAHGRGRGAHCPRLWIAHSAAPSRSSATWSGCTGSRSRRYSHSPSP